MNEPNNEPISVDTRDSRQMLLCRIELNLREIVKLLKQIAKSVEPPPR